MKVRALVGALALAGVMAPAFATNGYFAHGYGVKAQGMAGVGIAFSQDTLASATNPAGMVSVGDRLDVGVTWFRPQREATVVGSPAPGVNGTYSGNESENFFIPEFGYNKMLNSNMAVGVAVYGNGGMNTDYDKIFGLFSTTNKTGVNLEQLFIAPTFSMKLNPNHSIGISLNLAYQKFAAKGLENFAAFTPSGTTNSLTGQGHDDSFGWGVRLGWVGQITPTLALGATYQTKTNMGKFDKYKELFAEGGAFDIPANYGIGLAWKATPALTVAADIQTIEYSDIKSIANPLLPNLFSAPLGADSGPGFGWRDMTVYKLGVSYDYSPTLTLRAGYSTGRQPIPSSETMFNFLAPAVVENHLTLGATWKLPNKAELSVAYMHAFEEEIKGSGSIPAAFGGGEVNLKMYQDSLGVAYGMKF